jgi:hypothetical protein
LRGWPINDTGVKEGSQTVSEGPRGAASTEDSHELLAVDEPMLVDEPKDRDVAVGDFNVNVARRLRAVALILPPRPALWEAWLRALRV